MSYAGRGDLVPNLMSERDLLIATNGGSGAAVTEVTSVTDAKLAEADATINAYLSPRYALPLVDVPVLIQKTAAILARYYLLTIGGKEPGPQVIRDYDNAIKLLERIQKGQAGLGLTEAGEDPGVTASSSSAIRVSSASPRFGRSNLVGF